MHNKHGFTLVEVIVVTVIVAVLALAAVLLYMGYVRDARANVAESLAASAAVFLVSAVNVDVPVPGSFANPLNETGTWTLTLPSGGISTFRCPKGMTVQINEADSTVSATLKDVTSSSYKYNK